MKKISILHGSPRREGNTSQLARCFTAEAESLGCETEQFHLYDMELLPCLACRACQKGWTAFGCAQQDDMHILFDAIARCDVLVLASPIYSWYCTPPMKAVLDRMVYGTVFMDADKEARARAFARDVLRTGEGEQSDGSKNRFVHTE